MSQLIHTHRKVGLVNGICIVFILVFGLRTSFKEPFVAQIASLRTFLKFRLI